MPRFFEGGLYYPILKIKDGFQLFQIRTSGCCAMLCCKAIEMASGWYLNDWWVIREIDSKNLCYLGGDEDAEDGTWGSFIFVFCHPRPTSPPLPTEPITRKNFSRLSRVDGLNIVYRFVWMIFFLLLYHDSLPITRKDSGPWVWANEE